MGPLQAVVDLEVDLLDSLGQPEAADALLQTLQATDELEARRHHRAQDKALATAISEALDANPRHPSAHHDLALVLHRIGQHADAEQHYNAALAQNAEDHESRAGLIRLLVANKRLGEARSLLEQGLAQGQQAQLRDQVQLLGDLPVP
jgi:Flp pilus assembly protein TadD